MNVLLRRLRAIATIAVFWGLLWLIAGLPLVLATSTQPASDIVPPPALTLLITLAAAGVISGGIFATILAITERNHKMAQLSLLWFSVSGAIGSMIPPAIVVAILARSDPWTYDWQMGAAFYAVCAGLGAICAAATLTLARRAPAP
jgi:nitrate/nitrite transporter NarK